MPTETLTETHRWMIVISVMLATILEILDSTIVSIALPQMMGAFGTTFDQITWILTSYIVAAAIIMPISGFLINRLGSKKLLLINIIGFLISSMLCGLAVSLTQMVFFRILQGVFGASLVPLSQFILRNTFPSGQITKAMAIWGVGIMAGPILGPTIGGYITETLNWRWIFYINVPICLLDIFMCLKFVPETAVTNIKTDIRGVFLLILCVGCLQVFLDRGNTVNWFDAASSRWLLGIFMLSFAVFIYHSLTYRHPVINLRLFLNRNFSAGCFMIALFVAGMIGVISIQPLFMENLLQYPPDFAGLVMAPRGIASGIAMGFVPVLSKHLGEKTLIAAGTLSCALGTYFFSTFNLEISPDFFIGASILQGFGMGLFFVPLTTITFNTLSKEDYAEASGIFSFCRSVGMSMGISAIATLLSRMTQTNWNSLVGRINYFNPALTYAHINLHSKTGVLQLSHQVTQQATAISFLDVYRIVVIGLLLILPLVFLLKKSKNNTGIII